jgi:hypothetical protein
MHTSKFSLVLLPLLLLPFVSASGCDDPDDDLVVEDSSAIDRKLVCPKGDVCNDPSVCNTICKPTSNCNTQCKYDGEWTTCFDYDVCMPPCSQTCSSNSACGTPCSNNGPHITCGSYGTCNVPSCAQVCSENSACGTSCINNGSHITCGSFGTCTVPLCSQVCSGNSACNTPCSDSGISATCGSFGACNVPTCYRAYGPTCPGPGLCLDGGAWLQPYDCKVVADFTKHQGWLKIDSLNKRWAFFDPATCGVPVQTWNINGSLIPGLKSQYNLRYPPVFLIQYDIEWFANVNNPKQVFQKSVN